jgi:hypothetical protein
MHVILPFYIFKPNPISQVEHTLVAFIHFKQFDIATVHNKQVVNELEINPAE